MERKAVTILGISPGTRSIGIAVIQSGELIEWRMQTFKGTWSQKKLNAILALIQKLCEYHYVLTLSMKAIDPLHSSPQLNTLTTHIRLQARKIHIRVIEYSLPDIKESCGIRQETKDGIIEYVYSKYPELKREYLKERNNLHPYYAKMFEAIAAAQLLNQELLN